MLRAWLVLSIVGIVLTTAVRVNAASDEIHGQVKKVLPHLLDLQGRHTVSPSLFDRDAYQAQLRAHPEQVSGIRYGVLWKARCAADCKLTVRVELRGMFEGKVPRQATLEKSFDGKASIRKWTGLELTGEAYKRFGKITAWRTTLWCDDKMLDEYKSFLW